MLRNTPLAFVQRRGPQVRRAILATLAVLLVMLAFGFGRARAESESNERPAPFGPTDGVPDAWIVIMNEYVSDPAAAGPKLIAIHREAGADLHPMVQIVVADAYLRSGNRRAAQRLFENVLATDPPYPWNDFGNVGMGTVRMLAGDTDGASQYFERLTGAEEGSSRALGNLGMGSALAADGRFDEAKKAFDEVGSSNSVDEEVRLAGRFGSATALYGAGDYEGALKAFEEIAARDPDGPIGRDARVAAARARLALGQVDQGAETLRTITKECGDEKRARRTPRALRNLDARAIGRTWVRNYRDTAWSRLAAEGGGLYSIDGCSLARITLRAVERGDPTLTGVQRISTGASSETTTAAQPAPRRDAQPTSTAPSTSGTSWLPIAIAVLAAAALAFFFLRRSSAS